MLQYYITPLYIIHIVQNKIIPCLHFLHFVIYKHECVPVSQQQVALAVSLNLRTYLELKATSTGKVSIDLPNIDTFLSWDVSELKLLASDSFGKNGDSQACIMGQISGLLASNYLYKTQ